MCPGIVAAAREERLLQGYCGKGAAGGFPFDSGGVGFRADDDKVIEHDFSSVNAVSGFNIFLFRGRGMDKKDVDIAVFSKLQGPACSYRDPVEVYSCIGKNDWFQVIQEAGVVGAGGGGHVEDLSLFAFAGNNGEGYRCNYNRRSDTYT